VAIGPKGIEIGPSIERASGVVVVVRTIVRQLPNSLPGVALVAANPKNHLAARLKPRVILMDKPCSALDAEGIERIEGLIDGLREKYTILMVTHNMAQARRASHECIFMFMGRIVEHAPTLEMFLTPQQPETELYVRGRYG